MDELLATAQHFTGFTEEELKAISEAVEIPDVGDYAPQEEKERWCIEIPKEMAKGIKHASTGMTHEEIASRILGK